LIITKKPAETKKAEELPQKKSCLLKNLTNCTGYFYLILFYFLQLNIFMKFITTLLLVSGILFGISCKDRHEEKQQQQETPKALQDKSENSYELLTKKRYGTDLVDDLYDDLTEKNADLKSWKVKSMIFIT